MTAEARLTLDHALFTRRTGRGVRVAVVDSGIALQHPHVGPVASGVCLVCGSGGEEMADYRDRIGHGTAVAAAIRDKADNAALIAVRVFDRTLATSADVLARAIRWSADHDAALINLSLGTPNEMYRTLLGEAVAHAASKGALVVAAAEQDGTPMLPGSLPDAVGVVWDVNCQRDEMIVQGRGDERVRIAASGLPRPIPGVPPERNLAGISFAVANATGFLTRLLESRRVSLEELKNLLAEPA